MQTQLSPQAYLQRHGTRCSWLPTSTCSALPDQQKLCGLDCADCEYVVLFGLAAIKVLITTGSCASALFGRRLTGHRGVLD